MDARFLCRRGDELMEPRTLQSAVPGKLGSAAGKGRQSLQIRVFFREVGVAVAQETLIAVAEAMIEPREKVVGTDRERAQTTIGRGLIHTIRGQHPYCRLWRSRIIKNRDQISIYRQDA